MNQVAEAIQVKNNYEVGSNSSQALPCQLVDLDKDEEDSSTSLAQLFQVEND